MCMLGKGRRGEGTQLMTTPSGWASVMRTFGPLHIHGFTPFYICPVNYITVILEEQWGRKKNCTSSSIKRNPSYLHECAGFVLFSLHACTCVHRHFQQWRFLSLPCVSYLPFSQPSGYKLEFLDHLNIFILILFYLNINTRIKKILYIHMCLCIHIESICTYNTNGQ